MFENNMKIKKNCTQPHFPVPTYIIIKFEYPKENKF